MQALEWGVKRSDLRGDPSSTCSGGKRAQAQRSHFESPRDSTSDDEAPDGETRVRAEGTPLTSVTSRREN